LQAIARKCDNKLLKEIDLFDVYEGKNLEQGKKSYALSFILQDETQTLTDKVIDGVMQKIQLAYEKELGAKLRS
jgi:phenylalanyl-tRNA synthetase beta chain